MFVRTLIAVALLLPAGLASGIDWLDVSAASVSTGAGEGPVYPPAGPCGDCCFRGYESGVGVRLEYLMWWSGGQFVPPLATTSPAGTLREDAGVLGEPGTEVLFGGTELGQIFRSGGRLTVDYAIPDGCNRRIVGRLYGVEDGRETFVGTPGANEILARPFNNVTLGEADSFLISFPGVVDGDGRLFAQTRSDFLGTDLYLQQRMCDDGCFTLDWLAGYQFARLDDALYIESTGTSIDPQSPIPVGTMVEVVDHFRTRNEFHGASVGILGINRSGPWRLEYLFKLGIGNVHQTSIVEGRTTATEPQAAPVTSSGGLLALPTNIGTLERDRFTLVPEANFNIGYQIDQQWSLLFGYSFIYFPNAVLSGEQVDTRVNLSQLTGPLVGDARPAPRLDNSHFWLQGMSLGAEYKF
jgi:hypothetical protein